MTGTKKHYGKVEICNFSYFVVVDQDPHTPVKHILKNWARRKVGNACTKKTLYKRLPILTWLPKYSKGDAIGDLVAGITVGLMCVPQSLAYANVAGLPPEVKYLF